MLFNTLDYAWFLALVFVVTWLLVQRRFALILPWVALLGHALAHPHHSPTVQWSMVGGGILITALLIARTPSDEAPSPVAVLVQLTTQLGMLTYLSHQSSGLDPFSLGLASLRVPVKALGGLSWALGVLGALLSYSLVRARKVRLLCILLASYVFYAHWDYRFLPLIWGSSTADWWLAKKIDETKNPRSRKAWLMGTIFLNLGVLGFFKYFNFGIDSMKIALSAIGVAPPEVALRIALPVGISFFTFESMSYVIDVYRKELTPQKSYAEYLSFVAFFPHLVAGPIVRPRDLLPQLAAPGRFKAPEASEGLFLIAMGLGKKIIVGDYLALNLIDRVFDAPAMYSAVETYAAIVGYALQIYCDFSGYTDIAIGSALLLGVRFPLNFDSPYKAHNIVDFWRRWHISLSTWLRDYLYIPLGGNRKGRGRTYLNLMITMVLGGLWHGAAWTFVVWGFLHGAALAFSKWFQETLSGKHGRPRTTQPPAGATSQLNADVSTSPPVGPSHVSRHDEGSHVYDNASLGSQLEPSDTRVHSELAPVSRKGSPAQRPRRSAVRVLSVFLTVHFVCACWVFFRAESFDKARLIFARLASLSTHHQNLAPSVLGILALGVVGHYVPDKWFAALRSWFIGAPWPLQGILLCAAAWVLRKMASTDAVPFVYFQF